jgi:hypothetical protein
MEVSIFALLFAHMVDINFVYSLPQSLLVQEFSTFAPLEGFPLRMLTVYIIF